MNPGKQSLSFKFHFVHDSFGNRREDRNTFGRNLTATISSALTSQSRNPPPLPATALHTHAGECGACRHAHAQSHSTPKIKASVGDSHYRLINVLPEGEWAASAGRLSGSAPARAAAGGAGAGSGRRRRGGLQRAQRDRRRHPVRPANQRAALKATRAASQLRQPITARRSRPREILKVVRGGDDQSRSVVQ